MEKLDRLKSVYYSAKVNNVSSGSVILRFCEENGELVDEAFPRAEVEQFRFITAQSEKIKTTPDEFSKKDEVDVFMPRDASRVDFKDLLCFIKEPSQLEKRDLSGKVQLIKIADQLSLDDKLLGRLSLLFKRDLSEAFSDEVIKCIDMVAHKFCSGALDEGALNEIIFSLQVLSQSFIKKTENSLKLTLAAPDNFELNVSGLNSASKRYFRHYAAFSPIGDKAVVMTFLDGKFGSTAQVIDLNENRIESVFSVKCNSGENFNNRYPFAFNFKKGFFANNVSSDCVRIKSFKIDGARHDHDQLFSDCFCSDGSKNIYIEILSFSEGGKYLGAGYSNGIVKIRNLENKNLFTFNCKGAESVEKYFIRYIEFSSDEMACAVACHNLINLWNVETGKNLWTIQTDSPVGSLQFDPKGGKLAVGLSDNIICYDLGSKRPIFNFCIPRIRKMAFDSDGLKLATLSIGKFSNDLIPWGYYGYKINVFDLETCDKLANSVKIEHRHKYFPINMTFDLPNKELIIRSFKDDKELDTNNIFPDKNDAVIFTNRVPLYDDMCNHAVFKTRMLAWRWLEGSLSQQIEKKDCGEECEEFEEERVKDFSLVKRYGKDFDKNAPEVIKNLVKKADMICGPRRSHIVLKD